ncbi:MAG: hypothetical protein ACOWWR_15995 [Eubacteriales bacterium]
MYLLFKKKKGSIMVFVVMIMLLLSVFITSLLTLMVCRYQSIQHTIDYQKCFFLAQGGREEAVALLYENWCNLDSMWLNVEEGKYQYEITDIIANEKKIISQGEMKGFQRRFETIVRKASVAVDFQDLCEYTIYCDGNLSLKDVKNIKSEDEDPLIGVTNNLTIQHITGGRVKLDVGGKTIFQHASKEDYFYHCLSMDTNIPYYDVERIENNPHRLRDLNPEYFTEITGKGMDIVMLDHDSFVPDKKIYYVHHMDHLVLQELTLNGILVLENIHNITIDESAYIHGMMIVMGTEMNAFIVSGSLKGNMFLFNMEDTDVKLDGEIVYDIETIDALSQYLPNGLIENNSTKSTINVIKWNEIN